MTNETTASQPKSIGDDAQFRKLMLNFMHNSTITLPLRDQPEYCAIAAYIDSKLRAPADQAATVANYGDKGCALPPDGWYCIRTPGHDGPCAAWPCDEPVAPQQSLAPAAERDALAEAIHMAAVKRGIIAAEQPVNGAQLIMLCNDLASEGQAKTSVARIANLEAALRYYAEGNHFMLADESAWDTVSGEPVNFQCDEAGTATVEDGTIAKMVLAGAPMPADDEEVPITLPKSEGAAQSADKPSVSDEAVCLLRKLDKMVDDDLVGSTSHAFNNFSQEVANFLCFRALAVSASAADGSEQGS